MQFQKNKKSQAENILTDERRAMSPEHTPCVEDLWKKILIVAIWAAINVAYKLYKKTQNKTKKPTITLQFPSGIK